MIRRRTKERNPFSSSELSPQSEAHYSYFLTRIDNASQIFHYLHKQQLYASLRLRVGILNVGQNKDYFLMG